MLGLNQLGSIINNAKNLKKSFAPIRNVGGAVGNSANQLQPNQNTQIQQNPVTQPAPSNLVPNENNSNVGQIQGVQQLENNFKALPKVGFGTGAVNTDSAIRGGKVHALPAVKPVGQVNPAEQAAMFKNGFADLAKKLNFFRV